MRNFLKVNLKYGLLQFYKENVANCKYSHAFQTILKVKLESQAAPTLTTNEKNYLRTATWSEYAFENYNSNQRALAPFMQTSQKPVDSILSQKQTSQSGVVTYDLKDIGGRKGTGASLGHIFAIIEQAKAEMPEESKAASL